MIEFIKHSLGLCGESHLTIFHILAMIGGLSGVATMKMYAKGVFHYCCDCCKRKKK